jgi:hypothetical protein
MDFEIIKVYTKYFPHQMEIAFFLDDIGYRCSFAKIQLSSSIQHMLVHLQDQTYLAPLYIIICADHIQINNILFSNQLVLCFH